MRLFLEEKGMMHDVICSFAVFTSHADKYTITGRKYEACSAVFLSDDTNSGVTLNFRPGVSIPLFV